MKTIKFRVWTGAGMEYNVTVGKFGNFYVNPGKENDGLDENDSASLTRFNTKYSDEIAPAMQFTGLLDHKDFEFIDMIDSIHTQFPKLESNEYDQGCMDTIIRIKEKL